MAAVTSSVDTEASTRVFDPNFSNKKRIAFAFKDSILELFEELFSSIQKIFFTHLKRNNKFKCFIK